MHRLPLGTGRSWQPVHTPDGIQIGAGDQHVDIRAALRRTERLRSAEHGRDAVASVCPASQAPDKHMRDAPTAQPQFGSGQFPEEPLLRLRSIRSASCSHRPDPGGRYLESAQQSAGSGRMFHQWLPARTAICLKQQSFMLYAFKLRPPGAGVKPQSVKV
jgi:hypothetical protein